MDFDLNHDLSGGLQLCQIGDERQVAAAFSLMHQLRPQLANADAFIAYWKRASMQGYRLWSLQDDGDIVALASYRIQENIVHGLYLYIEDLVTDDAHRSCGYGQILMDKLKQQARFAGCQKIVLDTPLSNALGQRFYFRQGLLASALRFNQVLAA